MDNLQRTGFLELEKLKEQRTYLWYGDIRARIKAVDVRGHRVFIMMEEKSGVIHDFDKDVSAIPIFLSRLKFDLEKETGVTDFVKRKPPPKNKLDYEEVAIWEIHGKPTYIVFSSTFSKSDYIKKNKRFSYKSIDGKPDAICLYPEKNNGYKVNLKSKGRYGVFCGSISSIKHVPYILEIVEIGSKQAIKLLPKHPS